MNYSYARVYLLDNPYSIDKQYSYFIPHPLREDVSVGSFVYVPFGQSNKRQLALVLDKTNEEPNAKAKSIIDLANEEITLNEAFLGLCSFMKEQTLCTIGDAVHAMIPSGAFSYLVTYLLPKNLQLPEKYDDTAKKIFAELKEKGKVNAEALKKEFGSAADKAIKMLCNDGYVEKDIKAKLKEVGVGKKYYTLAVSKAELSSLLGEGIKLDGFSKLRSGAHREILSLLSLRERLIIDDIKKETGATDAQISALEKKGCILRETENIYRNPYESKGITPQRADIILNSSQEKVFSSLKELYLSGKPSCALLHGVTGSGKTSVMMRLIDEALNDGKGAILLIPEISLTPQTVNLFCSRYGSRVAIIHSSLSQGERLDAYMRIKRGEADLVIGTRSAVFAPVKNLSLIIIDEEQEHTYKSDTNPKYHARDIARYRCAKENALLLLASATPSVESYKKACDGVYTLLELNERYGKAKLPTVSIADTRESMAQGNMSSLSTPLLKEIATNIEKKEQSILFLNRRGYHNFVSCASCGKAISCPKCSVSMTCHTDRIYRSQELVCHWCGTHMPLPRVCPECGSEHIKPIGAGIQKVEKELEETFKSANIIRMDTDTASSKNAYENMLSDFRSHKADILLGTQMVTKGHDFPDVTLVGVLNADSSLYLNDYRAGEKTFAMLTQVIGRAGRADKAGRAVIQTTNPDSDVIRLACKQDYKTFYNSEIKTRNLLMFPPFCDIALLTMTGPEETALARETAKLANELQSLNLGKYSDVPLVIYGPFEAPVYKLDEKYRLRIVIKCKLNKRSRELFSELYIKYARKKKLDPSLSVDFNPSTL